MMKVKRQGQRPKANADEKQKKKAKSGIDIISILKYLMTLVLLAYMVLMVIHRGGDAPMAEVQKKVIKSIKTDGMKTADRQDFKKYYGLNAKDYADVVLFLPNDVMSVDELLIVRLNSEADAESVMKAAQKRLDIQKENFDGYGAEQTKLVESAILKSRGKYVFMVIHKDADKAYEAFKRSL